MAKPKAPLISFGALGSVAKTVTYAKWRGRQFARRHAAPTDRRTAAQLAARAVFATGNGIWNLAPALAIAPWNRHAAGRVFSGQNAWQGRFMLDNAGQSDLLALTLSPGAKGGLAPSTVVATPGPALITVDFTTPTPPVGWTLQAAIAATIRDGDPESTLFHVLIAGEDAPGAAQVVLSGLTPSVSYIVAGWLRWLKPDGSVAYGPSLPATAVTPTAPFVVNAVHFDGVNDWLLRGGGLTGAVDGPRLLWSLWFNILGPDATNLYILRRQSGRIRLLRTAGDVIQCLMESPAPATLWNFTSDDDFTATVNAGWNNLLIAAELDASPVGLAYLNDAPLAKTDLSGPTTGDIDWTATEWGVGATDIPNQPYDGDLSEFWLTDEYLDISVEANRRKFISDTLKPVDLGADGSLPTGTKPLIFFSGATASWHTNKGSGGGFTENGALTTAATSPSD